MLDWSGVEEMSLNTKANYFRAYPHDDFLVGTSLEIYSILDGNAYGVTILRVETKRDLVIVEANVDICDKGPIIVSPEEGEEYFQLGFLATNREFSPFSMT